MIEIPTGLPSEIVPLSWLIGEWRGQGMIEYPVDGEQRLHPFTQYIRFRDDGLGGLEYEARAELISTDAAPDASAPGTDASGLDGTHSGGTARTGGGIAAPIGAGAPTGIDTSATESGEPETSPLAVELGFWRLARPRDAGDTGPGMLPPSRESSFPDVDSVETLRDENDAFPLEVSIAHPTGVVEQYSGTIAGPRIDLATSGVLRAEGTADYRSATRMYGLVGGRLFWAWDIEALGTELQTHASAQLDRVIPATDDGTDPADPAPAAGSAAGAAS